IEELVQSGLDGRAVEVEESELDEEALVTRLRARDREIEIFQGSGRQGRGDEAEAFAATGFEDPGDEKTIQAIGVRALPVLLREAGDAGVLPVRTQDPYPRRHAAIHPGEMP